MGTPFVIQDGSMWWVCNTTNDSISLPSGEVLPTETITAIRLDELYMYEEREV